MREDSDIQDEVTDQERNEFLDLPIQKHYFWKALKEEASKRKIKTMRELLKKVPYYELRRDEIIREKEARAFINLLMYYECFQLLNLSYSPMTNRRKKKAVKLKSVPKSLMH